MFILRGWTLKQPMAHIIVLKTIPQRVSVFQVDLCFFRKLTRLGLWSKLQKTSFQSSQRLIFLPEMRTLKKKVISFAKPLWWIFPKNLFEKQPNPISSRGNFFLKKFLWLLVPIKVWHHPCFEWTYWEPLNWSQGSVKVKIS